MIKKIIILILIGVKLSYAQENYSADLIPEELKENANAVIRLSEINVCPDFARKSLMLTQRFWKTRKGKQNVPLKLIDSELLTS